VYYFDDAGDRSGDPTKPYFTMGGFGIDGDYLPQLNAQVKAAAIAHGFLFNHPAELKFSHVGLSKDNKPKRPHWMIRFGLREYAERRAMVYACLRAFAVTPSVKVLVTAVNQTLTYGGRSPIMHAVGPLFERINWDCIDHSTSGLVVCDEEQADDKKLRQATRTGSFYMQFANLVDTISFMPSEESIGVQIADLIAGSFSRYLNYGDPGYVRILWPKLRSHPTVPNRVNGYGVKIYPRGVCPVPPAQTEPLPKLDAKVAELERRARES
jgi:Protein of unknown function (DUF3800)